MESPLPPLSTIAEIREWLFAEGQQKQELFQAAARIKSERRGAGVYMRGLIEYSNVCRKNCYYCGIRRDQQGITRYILSERQVLDAATFAFENNYGSVVLQGGENTTEEHIATIERLLTRIKELSGGKLGITLSLGEQTLETYKRWYDAGAHRYLLRIETSNRDIYHKIHPRDGIHSYSSRMRALDNLRTAGYQVGTGVMIGLPFQTVDDMACDLLFMKNYDIDMCGMGPYIVSSGTPLAGELGLRGALMSQQWRFEMTLKMIALLRILMPDINIAATTALQAIDPNGRLKAIEAGANIIMPNISPEKLRGEYMLYDNKPLSLDSSVIEKQVRYGEWGDSPHFTKRKNRRH